MSPPSSSNPSRPTLQSARAEAPPLEPGEVLSGKYELRRVIGEGGMGSVWLARHLVLQVDVAVKLIRPHLGSAHAVERLLREARAAAQIEHPSIVRVYDYGETPDEIPFLVMEVIDGGSLADVLEMHQRLTATAAVQMLLPVASALGAAHDRGIVHRDLKPDNIMLARDPWGGATPKIVDFGIAKVQSSAEERAFTRAGEIIGSPGYLSPQQARGLPVDERADVWSFAVMLYELVTGVLPFDGPNHTVQLASILESAPTPTCDLAAGDAELWAIIERGLEKDLDARWPTIRSFGRALADWALARGVERDVTGQSIKDHWLGGAPCDPPTENQSPRPTAASVPTMARRERSGGRAWLVAAGFAAAFIVGEGSQLIGAYVTPEPNASPILGAHVLAVVASAGAPIAQSTAVAVDANPLPDTLPATTAAATAPTTTATAAAAPRGRLPARAPSKPAGTTFLPIPQSPGF